MKKFLLNFFIFLFLEYVHFLQINNKIMYSGIMSKLKYTDSFFEKE
jgi:hypothetical protein